MASTTEAEAQTKPFSVLFVCLGNICRSPAAEGVFRDFVKKRGLDSKFNIDSAGTISYHEGNEADPRMRAAYKRRGIEITSISRPIRPSDFTDFDLILAMDKQNREDILGAFERWSHREPLSADAHKKVRLMCSYCKKHDETQVPDPCYGGPHGFEKEISTRNSGNREARGHMHLTARTNFATVRRDEEYSRRIDEVLENERTTEIRDRIFDELIGPDGYGYVRTYGVRVT